VAGSCGGVVDCRTEEATSLTKACAERPKEAAALAGWEWLLAHNPKFHSPNRSLLNQATFCPNQAVS